MNSPFLESFIAFLEANHISYRLHFPFISIETQTIQLVEFGSVIDRTKPSIIIHEDLWRHKKSAVQSRVLSILGKNDRIHGRLTTVKPINKIEANAFIDAYHLNETTQTKHNIGLFYKDELVSVATFSRRCPVHRNGIIYQSNELVRFCSLPKTTVVGGLDKLIKHFIKTHSPDDIVTYIDNEWSNGNGFKCLGFIEHSTIAPQQFFMFSSTPRVYLSKYNPNALYPDGYLSENLGSTKLILDLKQDSSL